MKLVKLFLRVCIVLLIVACGGSGTPGSNPDGGIRQDGGISGNTSDAGIPERTFCLRFDSDLEKCAEPLDIHASKTHTSGIIRFSIEVYRILEGMNSINIYGSFLDSDTFPKDLERTTISIRSCETVIISQRITVLAFSERSMMGTFSVSYGTDRYCHHRILEGRFNVLF